MLMIERRINRARAAALAVVAALALASIPVSNAFADDGPHGPGPKPAPKPKPRPAPVVLAAANSAQCSVATTALQLFIAGDASEDVTERQTARLDRDDPGEQLAEAVDRTEDEQERAQSDLLHANARKACEPQPPAISAQCAAAQKALQDYNASDATEDRSEAALRRTDVDDRAQSQVSDKAEDQTENAVAKTYRDAVQKNCEPQPSPQCLAARTALNAFNVADRSEDKTEQPTPSTDRDDNPQAQPSDQTEDQAENAQQHQLQEAASRACGAEPHPDH
jgi:hypothetical protein